MRRVCYFGTYDSGYDRNRLLIAALRGRGVEVLECHEPLLQARKHKTGLLDNPLGALSMATGAVGAYALLGQRYLRMPDHDAVIVGYLGHLDALFASPLARARRKPLVFDAFISLHDTLVHDRQIFREGSAGARLAAMLDTASCAVADRVLLDTEAHARLFHERFGVPEVKLAAIPVGADPDRYRPLERPLRQPGQPFRLLHYAKFAPLHGLDTILRAVAQLRDAGEDVELLLVGGGQLENDVERWMAELRLGPPTVEWRRWIEPDDLATEIARADATLGIFGGSGKAGRVIPNKVYQCMAAAAPIITRASEAASEVLVDEEHVLLVPPEDPEALAGAVRRLIAEPELGARLGAAARAKYLEVGTPEAIGDALAAVLGSLSEDAAA